MPKDKPVSLYGQYSQVWFCPIWFTFTLQDDGISYKIFGHMKVKVLDKQDTLPCFSLVLLPLMFEAISLLKQIAETIQ